MRVWTGLSAVGLAAVLLAGCAGVEASKFNQQKLSAEKDFNSELARGFQLLSKSAYNEGNYPLADYYTERGRQTVAGSPPAPQDQTKFPVPADKAGELNSARSRLLATYDQGVKTSLPDTAARCQVMYESWLEEQSQNAPFQQDQIANARTGALECIARLENYLKKPPVAAIAPESFQIFFDFDKYVLRPEAPETLKKFVEHVKKTGATKIRVVGHTDTVGSLKYNLWLSQRRADTVKQFLVSQGIPAADIVTTGVAFKDLLVPTPPGVPELKNRRAQMFAQKPGS